MRIKDLLIITKGDYLSTLVLLFLINCITAPSSAGQSFPFKFNYITVDEGLSHTDANYIAQDNKGYIWVATNFGLDRYDGYSVKKYYNNNAPLEESDLKVFIENLIKEINTISSNVSN